MTETPASTPDAAAKRSAAVVLGGCCLGVLLILDQTSGDVLTCGLISFSDGGDASRGVFSAAEVQKITDLSKSLAGSDDNDSNADNGSNADTALSNADQQKVEPKACGDSAD